MNNDDVSRQGYKSNSPYRNNPYLIINSPKGVITMDNVKKPLVVKDLQYNETKVLLPNSGNHSFKGNKMLEIPINNSNTNDENKRNMFNRPTDKNLFKSIFDKNKLKMGGYAMPNEIIEKTLDTYAKKKGGFILNPKDTSTLLPFVEKQYGGYTSVRSKNTRKYQEGGNIENEVGTSVNDNLQEEEEEIPSNEITFQKERPKEEIQIKEVTLENNNNGVDFNTWMQTATEKEQFKNLPDEIQDSLEYFIEDDNSKSNLSEDFVKKNLPEVYRYWNNNIKQKEVKRGGGTVSATSMADFVTRPVQSRSAYKPKLQYGGNTSYSDYNANNQMSKYQEGTLIRYRKGGQIVEGVVKSYNPQTGKYSLH